MSDNELRKELQQNATGTLRGAKLYKKMDPIELCQNNEPSRYRYICWRYNEIGGEIWRYYWSGKTTGSYGFMLIKNNTPIAKVHWYGNKSYKQDKNKKDLGHVVVKGVNMPKKNNNFIQKYKNVRINGNNRLIPIIDKD